MAPRLYKTDSSPPSRAVMMVADILGLELDKQDLNPVAREQDSPEMVAVSDSRSSKFERSQKSSNSQQQTIKLSDIS